MSDFLTDYYLWTKALHVISVIAWMAGLFYLPRLFVYHVEKAGSDGAQHDLFQVMERRLYHAIMNPAMLATWLFGLTLVFTPGIIDWTDVWPWIKAAMVLGMTWFHLWLGAQRLKLASGTCTITGRGFRMMNEVPTLLMVVIVIMVITQPF